MTGHENGIRRTIIEIIVAVQQNYKDVAKLAVLDLVKTEPLLTGIYDKQGTGSKLHHLMAYFFFLRKVIYRYQLQKSYSWKWCQFHVMVIFIRPPCLTALVSCDILNQMLLSGLLCE